MRPLILRAKTRLTRRPAQTPALASMILKSILIAITVSCNMLYASEYRIENGWIELSDGVKLAVTYYIPESAAAGEENQNEDAGEDGSEGANDDKSQASYPVLLEMLPYRKDDLSKAWAHPLYDHFASQGLALAKVDVRGTGSSEGTLPEREYSSQEIDDAVEVIAALSQQPWANGNVGMWGISWGGFNAIQVALRNPPQLKAILAAHASDDLFKNDVHYTDGIFGVDEYILSINHMTGFMRSPDYEINDSYFKNRFDREPWLFETLRNGVANDFWNQGSLRLHYQDLTVPVYLIGGLLDGYRDTLPHVLENANVPVRATLGPWPHAWPDSASPGPTWEWREDAASWWKYWLDTPSAKNLEFETNSFKFFQRGGNAPDVTVSNLNGQWQQSPWPLPDDQSRILTFYPSRESSLIEQSNQYATSDTSLDRIASSGIELGEWWGELLPDMTNVDKESLVFDSKAFDESLTVLGIPNVDLLSSSDAADGHWIVRLEDVSPDGKVALITGGAINGQFRESAAMSKSLQPGEFYNLSIPLRMTTWTIQRGHRLRLAISNSAFPMFWPSPALGKSTLKIDSEATRLQLPLWTGGDIEDPSENEKSQQIEMAEGGPSDYLDSNIISLGPVAGSPRRKEIISDDEAGLVTFIRESGLAYTMEELILESSRHTSHQANIKNPALTHYEGWAEYALQQKATRDEKIVYRTEIDLRSDETHFHLEVSRILMSGDEEIRRRNWQESLLRNAH